MLTSTMHAIEREIIAALRQAAESYRKEQGRFLPIAERAIHDALEDYQSMHGKAGHGKREITTHRRLSGDRLRVAMMMPDERIKL